MSHRLAKQRSRRLLFNSFAQSFENVSNKSATKKNGTTLMECRSVKLFCACTFNLFHLLFVVVLVVAVVLCCCGGGSVMVLLIFLKGWVTQEQLLFSLVRGLQTNKLCKW